MHGTRRLSVEERDREYSRLTVDLRDSRWAFLNTLFSVSEGCLYAQLVDRLDSGELVSECKPPFDYDRCCTYDQLYGAVSKALFRAHVQGQLKDEVMRDPAKFIYTDSAFAQTLLEQREAGKKLALITNSDWVYTRKLMSFTYDPFLPAGMSWRDLFDVVVVSASKPEFFSTARRPVYEIVSDDGMLREAHKFDGGKAYAGGNANMVEKLFGVSGPRVLYVGDHIFTDVNMAKRGLSWRTCLILQELEAEVAGLENGKERTHKLQRLFRQKDEQSSVMNFLKSKLDSAKLDSLAETGGGAREGGESDRAAEEAEPLQVEEIEVALARLRGSLAVIEEEINLLLWDEGAHVNRHWGFATRAGFADKSHLMRQIEKYADIYTSRVSNFLRYTPYKHFICGQQSLAHNRESEIFEHFKVKQMP